MCPERDLKVKSTKDWSDLSRAWSVSVGHGRAYSRAWSAMVGHGRSWSGTVGKRLSSGSVGLGRARSGTVGHGRARSGKHLGGLFKECLLFNELGSYLYWLTLFAREREGAHRDILLEN